MVLSVKCQEGT